MFNSEKEKLEFIKRHSKEIESITNYKEILDDIEQSSNFETIPDRITSTKTEYILEEFETKISILEKLESRPDQKRVLVEADNPGAYAAIKPLISELKRDERCSGIMALTSGLAALYFQRDFKDFFSHVREKDNPVLVDILDTIKEKPADVVLATLSVKNAPDSVALFGSKSNLGAKKLFLILEGWGQNFNANFFENKENLDKIDGIFVNDEFAKSILLYHFPDFSEYKIYTFGTPILDSLDIKHSDEYRKSLRKKLDIDEKTAILTYLGFISWGSKELYGSCDDIDEKTFQDTFRQIIKLAEENPDKNFVFAFRPHPRDDKKEEKYKFARSIAVPPNLSFKDGGGPLSMNEVAYGSDIIMGINSTENFLAPLRGRKGIFLGFSGKGMGEELLEKLYGKTAVQLLKKQSEAIHVVDSPESLKKELVDLMNKVGPLESAKKEINATKRILDIALEP